MTINDACAFLRVAEWRRVTINGQRYRTHPDNVPPGTLVGQEFVLLWLVGNVWARLEADLDK